MNTESAVNTGKLSIVDGLVQLSFLIQSILSRAGAKHDLSVIQIRLLGILRDRQPSMQQLAQHLQLDKSSITGLIDRAERRGLVERIISPTDRRGFYVRITGTGRELAALAGNEIEEQILQSVAGLSEADRAQLAELAAAVLGSPHSSEAPHS